jgi:hypothetical protein
MILLYPSLPVLFSCSVANIALAVPTPMLSKMNTLYKKNTSGAKQNPSSTPIPGRRFLDESPPTGNPKLEHFKTHFPFHTFDHQNGWQHTAFVTSGPNNLIVMDEGHPPISLNRASRLHNALQKHWHDHNKAKKGVGEPSSSSTSRLADTSVKGKEKADDTRISSKPQHKRRWSYDQDKDGWPTKLVQKSSKEKGLPDHHTA